MTATDPGRAYLAGAHVQVQQIAGGWSIAGRRHRVLLDAATLGINIHAGPTTWSLRPSRPGDLRVTLSGDAASSVDLQLSKAQHKEITPFDTGERVGLRIALTGFSHAGEDVGVEVVLLLALEHLAEEVICEAVIHFPSPSDNPGGATVKEITWPAGFITTQQDSSVMPWGQGGLLRGDWPHPYKLAGAETHGSWNQCWWGHQRGASAAMCILDTTEDADVRAEHPAGGPTRIENTWLHSLGEMRYPRRARLCFFATGNYVDLAKRYRRHAIESGLFVSLKQKIAATPRLARIIGAPVVHTHIHYHTAPSSQAFNATDPSKNDNLVSFAERAAQLRRLHARGVHNAYVHLDGWGFRGYDNLHPDPLPPSPAAGGWDGFRGLADTADELGYTLILHDQYRDYYVDAPTYNPQWSVLNEHGQRHRHAIWAGGTQELLCSTFAPGHVAKNFAAILERGVKVRGAYLDVFSCVPMDECYHPDHPVTRGQCMLNRARCLNMIRDLFGTPGGGVVTSETAIAWAVPFVHGVHWLPYAGLGKETGHTEVGACIPLFALVFHEALFTPWVLGRGLEATQPPGDWGFLHALLHGSMVYLPIEPSDEDLRLVRIASALNRRVALYEMTGHEFPDGPGAPGGRRQRTTFADGTTVAADFVHDAYEISPALSDAELSRAFEVGPTG